MKTKVFLWDAVYEWFAVQIAQCTEVRLAQIDADKQIFQAKSIPNPIDSNSLLSVHTNTCAVCYLW